MTWNYLVLLLGMPSNFSKSSYLPGLFVDYSGLFGAAFVFSVFISAALASSVSVSALSR